MDCVCSQEQLYTLSPCAGVSQPLMYASAMLQLSSAYKPTTDFSILSIEKFLRSYLIPQLSLYSSALLDRKTRKTCWCSSFLFLFLPTLLNHRQPDSSVMATNCLPHPVVIVYFLFFLFLSNIWFKWSSLHLETHSSHDFHDIILSVFFLFFLWSLFLSLCWILCIFPPFSSAPAYRYLSISCLYPFFLNDHLHFCSFVYHLYNSQIYILSPGFWMSLWNPQSDIQYLADAQQFSWISDESLQIRWSKI